MQKTGGVSRRFLITVVIIVVGEFVNLPIMRADQTSARLAAPTLAHTRSPAAHPPPPSKTTTVAKTKSSVTAGDMKREKKGRYGAHAVNGVEKDGQLLVTFAPALPRNDRAVLGGAEYALRQFRGVNTTHAKWQPATPFLRVTTGGGAFDVLLIKNDNGTVHSMSITKRQ